MPKQDASGYRAVELLVDSCFALQALHSSSPVRNDCNREVDSIRLVAESKIQTACISDKRTFCPRWPLPECLCRLEVVSDSADFKRGTVRRARALAYEF